MKLTFHNMNFSIKEMGFSLLSAIFLLLVLSGVTAVMVTFTVLQNSGDAVEHISIYADDAAYAGLEWGRFQVMQQAAGVMWPACSVAPATAAWVTTIAPHTLAGVLDPFSVQVECVADSFEVTKNSWVWHYTITSTATGVAGAVPGDLNYVERVQELELMR